MNGKLLAFVVVSVLILLFGCAGGETPQQPGATAQQGGVQAPPGAQTAPPAGQLKFSDPQLQGIYDAAMKASPPKPTSLDNLADAYEKGTMGKEEYITNSILAIYEPSSLPSQYAGVPLEAYDVSDELMLAIENWDSLSEEQQNKIKQYVMPETPEGEVVELDGENTRLISFDADPAAPQKSGVRFGAPVTYILYKITAVPGKVTVWSMLPQGHTAAEKDAMDDKISVIKKAVVDAYPKFKALLGVEPQNEAQIWMKTLPSGTWGEASIYSKPSDPVERCRLAVDYAQPGGENEVKATTAHELFHCFQYHIPLRQWNNTDQKWLREATATWSENYVYPGYNTEQKRLPLFFTTRHYPLVHRFGLKEYADYLFFYFLEKKAGSEAVAKVMKDAKTMGVRSAMEKITDYQDKHAEFSVWNYNTDPVLRYTDTPSFPGTGVVPPAFLFEPVAAGQESDIRADLQSGAAEYRMFVVMDDENTKKMKFKFGTPEEGALQRHALIKIGDIWTEEDWTHLPEKVFCRNKPQEKVAAVVLVYSNSNLVDKSPKAVSYKLDTNGECPLEISGTTRVVTEANAGPVKMLKVTWTSNDVLEYYEDEDGYGSYRLKTTHQTCTYSESSDVQAGLIRMTMQRSGSGSYSKTYSDLSESPRKIRFDWEDGDVSFFVDHQDNDEWVNYAVKSSASAEGGGSSDQTWSEQDSCLVIVPGTYGFDFWDLPMDKFLEGDRLHGRVSHTEGSVTSIVEFDYIIPGLQ